MKFEDKLKATDSAIPSINREKLHVLFKPTTNAVNDAAQKEMTDSFWKAIHQLERISPELIWNRFEQRLLDDFIRIRMEEAGYFYPLTLAIYKEEPGVIIKFIEPDCYTPVGIGAVRTYYRERN